MSNGMEYISSVQQGIMEWHIFKTGENEYKTLNALFYDKQGNCTYPLVGLPTDSFHKPITEPIDKKENPGC